MSANERIRRLQSLLERVQSRTGRPRGNGVAHAAAAVSYAPPAPAELEEVPAEAHVSAPPQAAYASAPPQAAYASAPPQAAYASEPAEALPSYDEGSDGDAELEISSETVEVDIDIDEPMPMESGAQPVAQQTMPPDDLEDEAEEPPTATQPSQRPMEPDLEEEVAQAAPLANEIEEPAPSSSRRPIAGEEPAPGAYEEESAPRHTPPPESGKQVAAPSVSPPGRVSVSPASLEGHTLIGGWREPGLGGPQISHGASTGVRVPPPAGMGTEPRASDTQRPAQASGARLTADVVQPEFTADVSVASFQGAPAIARPATMGELLDLTLGL